MSWLRLCVETEPRVSLLLLRHELKRAQLQPLRVQRQLLLQLDPLELVPLHLVLDCQKLLPLLQDHSLLNRLHCIGRRSLCSLHRGRECLTSGACGQGQHFSARRSQPIAKRLSDGRREELVERRGQGLL